MYWKYTITITTHTHTHIQKIYIHSQHKDPITEIIIYTFFREIFEPTDKFTRTEKSNQHTIFSYHLPQRTHAHTCTQYMISQHLKSHPDTIDITQYVTRPFEASNRTIRRENLQHFELRCISTIQKPFTRTGNNLNFVSIHLYRNESSDFLINRGRRWITTNDKHTDRKTDIRRAFIILVRQTSYRDKYYMDIHYNYDNNDIVKIERADRTTGDNREKEQFPRLYIHRVHTVVD